MGRFKTPMLNCGTERLPSPFF